MKKGKTALLLTSAVIFSALVLAACGQADGREPSEDTAASVAEDKAQTAPLPDSILYYGEILEIRSSDNGAPSMLLMDSQADGEYSFSLGDETVWIDSGNFKAFRPDELQAGERVYIFHSPVMTMSLPPQSPALAVVKNIPMDARCAMYHSIESIEVSDGAAVIGTDNGTMKISADSDTLILGYDGSPMSLSDLKEGGRMMVIYEELMNSAPSDPRAHSIMFLP